MTTLRYLHLQPGQPPPPLAEARFKAVLIIEDAVTDEWRERVSDWLVLSGCLYMMAWGRDCSSWHDSVDDANLATFDDGEIPDDAYVTTTWHTEDSLADVFWFAQHTASHPTVDLACTIIVHIASEPREADMLKAFHDARTQEDTDGGAGVRLQR